jgi:hypothetical protein
MFEDWRESLRSAPKSEPLLYFLETLVRFRKFEFALQSATSSVKFARRVKLRLYNLQVRV